MCACYANIMFRSKWSLKLAKMIFSFISIHFTAEIRSKMNNCVIQLAFRMDDSLKLNIYFDWNVSSCHCMVSLPNCRFHLKSFQPVECETIFDLVIVSSWHFYSLQWSNNKRTKILLWFTSFNRSLCFKK